jgi:hypothetical protein
MSAESREGRVFALAVAAPWGPVHVAATERGVVAVELMTTREAFADRLERRLHRPITWLDDGGSEAEEGPAGDDSPNLARGASSAIRSTWAIGPPGIAPFSRRSGPSPEERSAATARSPGRSAGPALPGRSAERSGAILWRSSSRVIGSWPATGRSEGTAEAGGASRNVSSH